MDLNSRSRSHETANCDKDLLKMGLELLGNLNKSLKLPYAIVKPRIQKGEMSEESDAERESSLSPPSMAVNVRKRKHSGEMTEMEKKEKRRMMNRVAAQTARDRKKQYVVELEKKLAQLEDQNKCLVKENEQLKQHTSLLESEKLLLEQKLSQSTMPVNRESEMECTTGSAVSNVPLLQERTLSPLLQTWLVISLISWIYYTKNWHHHHPNQVAPVLMLRSLHSQMNHQILETEQFLHKQNWWGAHNRGWNPPMNLI